MLESELQEADEDGREAGSAQCSEAAALGATAVSHRNPSCSWARPPWHVLRLCSFRPRALLRLSTEWKPRCFQSWESVGRKEGGEETEASVAIP